MHILPNYFNKDFWFQHYTGMAGKIVYYLIFCPENMGCVREALVSKWPQYQYSSCSISHKVCIVKSARQTIKAGVVF